MQTREHRMLHGPVLPVLAALALPNILAMVAVAATSIAETTYVGLLGRDALAGMALIFPLVMLMQTFSAGAMGGGVSSAISRALGAGDEEGARSLARHAVVIALAAGASSPSCSLPAATRCIDCWGPGALCWSRRTAMPRWRSPACCWSGWATP